MSKKHTFYTFASGKIGKITFLVAVDRSKVLGPPKLLLIIISALHMVDSCQFSPTFYLNCQIIDLFFKLEEKYTRRGIFPSIFHYLLLYI